MGLNVADAKVQHCQTAEQVRALNRAVLERKRARNRPPRRITINDLTPGSFPIVVHKPVVFREIAEISYPEIASIIDLVCQTYCVTKIDLVSHRRQPNIVLARQVAQTLACRLTPHSLPMIAKHFGGRDHTTILHAREKIERLRAKDRWIDETMSSLEARLGGYNPQIKIYGARQVWSPQMDARLRELIAGPKTWNAITKTLESEFGITLARTACYGRMYTLGLRRSRVADQPLIAEAA